VTEPKPSVDFAVRRVRASLRFSAANRDDAQALALSVRSWLHSLKRVRAARFLSLPELPADIAIAEAAEESGSGAKQQPNGSTTTDAEWTVPVVFDVVGGDADLALARFGHFRGFVTALIQSGVDDQAPSLDLAIGEGEVVGDPRAESIPTALATYIHPSASSWADDTDDGAWTERDVIAVEHRRLCESLILDTDERQEAVRALEKCAQFLALVEGDVYEWKWAIISMHNAVQAFMVLALQGTQVANVLKRDIRGPVFAAQAQGDRDAMPTKFILDDFLELYERIKKLRPGDMRRYGHSQAFRPESRHTRSIKWLNRHRNEFLHFVPISWLIEVALFPKQVHDCLDVIEFLVNESNNIDWFEHEHEERARRAIADIRASCAWLADLYADRVAKFEGKVAARKLRIPT